jgi:hypothetical protein
MMPCVSTAETKQRVLSGSSQAWTDYQLQWNASEYGGVDSVVLNPRLLWIPDILLYNR